MLRRLEKKVGKDATRSFKQTVCGYIPREYAPMARYVLACSSKDIDDWKDMLGCKELYLAQFYVSTFGCNLAYFSDADLQRIPGDASMELVCFYYEKSAAITSKGFIDYVLYYERADIFESKIKGGIYPFKQSELFTQSVAVDSTLMLPWLCHGKDDEYLEKMLWDKVEEYAEYGVTNDQKFLCELPLRVFRWCTRYHNAPEAHVNEVIYSIMYAYCWQSDLKENNVDEDLLLSTLRHFTPMLQGKFDVNDICACVDHDSIIREHAILVLSMCTRRCCQGCTHPELHKP